MRVPTADILRAAIQGDMEAFSVVRAATHEVITLAATEAGTLTVRRDDVVSVLRRMQSGLITPALAKSWASFVRRGYVAEPVSRGPIRPIAIDYDQQREPEVADAIGRIDELGDRIDGTIDEGEVRALIQALSQTGIRRSLTGHSIGTLISHLTHRGTEP